MFGQRLLEDGLAGAEAARDDGGAAGGDGEEAVEDALPGEEGDPGRQAAPEGARPLGRPALHHGDRSIAVEDDHRIDDAGGAGAHLGHPARLPGRHQDAVDEAGGLAHLAEDGALGHRLAGDDAGDEIPHALAIEGRRGQAAPDEVAGGGGQAIERTLDTVDHLTEEAGAELDGERLAAGGHRLAERQPGGVLVDLQGGAVAADADHLAEQPLVADPDDLTDGRGGEAGGDDGGAGDLLDARAHLSLTW
jgi:hypothetical protein